MSEKASWEICPECGCGRREDHKAGCSIALKPVPKIYGAGGVSIGTAPSPQATELVDDRMSWQPISTAPKDRFILVYCAEDNSRWLAKWQGRDPHGRWYGIDEHGLTREGGSNDRQGFGYAVDAWMPLPDPPIIGK
jgi:hypothetical protein